MSGHERQPERLIARVRPHARRLTLPSLALVAVSGGASYGFFALDELWQRLAVAAGALAAIVLLWMLPLLRWLSTQYLITTRRLVLRHGLLVRTRQEVLLSRSSDVSVRRSGLQSMFRSGDVLVGAGLDRPIVLRDVPRARARGARRPHGGELEFDRHRTPTARDGRSRVAQAARLSAALRARRHSPRWRRSLETTAAGCLRQ